MSTIQLTLNTVTKRLEMTSPSARIDAEVLLMHVLQKNRAFLYTYPELALSESVSNRLEELVQKRILGQPIAHLIGTQAFWSLTLSVNESTLIPRPETELLVEYALSTLTQPKTKILELGTGSGAIALALAHERPNWSIDAGDISAKALEVARLNAKKLHLTQVNFFETNWFSQVKKTNYDAIFSNPPYIANNDPHLQEGDLRYEPPNALASGPDGLTAIEHLIKLSPTYLKPGGYLAIEHGYNQKEAIRSLFMDNHYQDIACFQDHQGLDRLSVGAISS